MALEQMFEHIKQETEKEIEQQINSAKVDMTRTLVDLTDTLEESYRKKQDELTLQYHKKENIIKAEKELRHKMALLENENQIAEQILTLAHDKLLEYTNGDAYKNTMQSWYEQAISAVNNPSITLTINPRDEEIFRSLSSSTLNTSTTIKAGFILTSTDGETIDLSFNTIFNERRQQLLQYAMSILKETL